MLERRALVRTFSTLVLRSNTPRSQLPRSRGTRWSIVNGPSGRGASPHMQVWLCGCVAHLQALLAVFWRSVRSVITCDRLAGLRGKTRGRECVCVEYVAMRSCRAHVWRPGRPTTTGILILKAQRRCRRQASQHDHIVTSASLIWQGLHARCLISFGRISCLAYPTPYPVHLQPLATCIRGYGHRLGMADGKLSHYYAQYCTRCGTAWHQPAQGSFHHHGMAGFGCTVRRFPGMRPCRFMVRCATHDQWGVWKRSAK